MPNPSSINLTANQQLASTANQALGKVLQYLESAEAFAIEQAPLLVQEVLRFEVLTRGFWLLFGIALLIWCPIGLRFAFRKADQRIKRIDAHYRTLKEDRNSDYDTVETIFTLTHYGVPISAAISGVTGLVMALCSLEPFIKVLIAPRLFLLEYFRALVG